MDDPARAPKLNQFGRTPKAATFISQPSPVRGLDAHDRFKYYDELARRKLLDTTAEEMKRSQEFSLTRQAEDAFTAKFEEMKRIVAEERRRQLDLRVIAERPPLPSSTPSSPPQSAPAPAAVVALRPVDTLLQDISHRACANPEAITDELASGASHLDDVLDPEGLRRKSNGCELAVLNVLIDIVEGRYGATAANKSWIERLVRDYRAANTPRIVLPPEDTTPPPRGGDCRRGDDPFGCQPRHP